MTADDASHRTGQDPRPGPPAPGDEGAAGTGAPEPGSGAPEPRTGPVPGPVPGAGPEPGPHGSGEPGSTADGAGVPDPPAAVGADDRDAAERVALYHRIPKAKLVWLLLRDTVQSCTEHRIVGMAAEAAFFTLLSLPPLLLGLIGLLSSLDALAGTDMLETARSHILDVSTTMLSERGVNDVVRPLIDDLTKGPRPDVMSFGFVVALWSGSRAVNVFVGTITVMYGMEGYRNPAATRLLAFLMYLVSLAVGAVVVPALVIGPELAIGWFPGLEGQLRIAYWPVVLLLCVGFLTTLYHVSVPVRSPWREDIPGAMVALAIWAVCAFALRAYLRTTVEGPSMYGSLAVPVAILLWLGVSAFAVLVGAALNAAVDRVWPTAATAAARAETDEAREAAAEAMLAAVRERRSRAEKLGVQAYDMTATAMRLAGTLRPSELRQQLKAARKRRRKEAGRRVR